MTDLPIDQNRIKISLNRREAVRLFGDITPLKRDPKTGNVLKSLLKKAVKDMGYRPKRREIIARAVKNRRGGLDIFFSGQGKTSSRENNFILEFSSIRNLADAARALVFSLPEFYGQGSLYFFEGKYRLLLPSLCAKFEIDDLAGEFFGKVLTGECNQAVTEEYGRLILPEKAVGLTTKL